MRAALSASASLRTVRCRPTSGSGWSRCSPSGGRLHGRLRGARHTMLDDSDISSTRHARAFVAGALAGSSGHAEIFVSGGAEHQGPDGGGPVALHRHTPGSFRMSALEKPPRAPSASKHVDDEDLRSAHRARHRLDHRDAGSFHALSAARTARASPRSSNASWVSTSRPAARCWSTVAKVEIPNPKARRATSASHGLPALHAGAVPHRDGEPRDRACRRTRRDRLEERAPALEQLVRHHAFQGARSTFPVSSLAGRREAEAGDFEAALSRPALHDPGRADLPC